MKIIVYAISKNEASFVNRWVKSMNEADEIYVLDTGSTDNTVDKLKKKNVKVYSKKYDYFRFDKARNDSLDLLPKDTDICVCTDLDEVFEKGWRKKLENVYNEKITRYEYTYNWSKEVSFISNKIHTRNDYKWIHPVHEVLKNTNGNEKSKLEEAIILNHYPDRNKSRSSYLPLLELSVKENPFDERNLHYLGREYMYYKHYNKAIETLIKHISISTWKEEKSASMRFIARCYKNIKRYKESELWYKEAIKETPFLRDPYIELSMLKYEQKKWKSMEYYLHKSLNIKFHDKTYINEPFSWNETPYDLLSISYFNQGKYKSSLKYINKALDMNKNNRLLNNKKIIESYIKKNQ